MSVGGIGGAGGVGPVVPETPEQQKLDKDLELLNSYIGQVNGAEDTKTRNAAVTKYQKKLQDVENDINKFQSKNGLTKPERNVYDGLSLGKHPLFNGLVPDCAVNQDMLEWEPGSLKEIASTAAQEIMSENGY